MLASLSLSLFLGLTPVPHSQNLNQPFTLPDTSPIIRTVKTHDDTGKSDDLNSDLYDGMDPYEAKIVYLESRGDEHAFNGKYYGLFQLDLAYLKGDLSRKNQFKTAKRYLNNRYNGSWKQAYEFHIANNWW